MIFRFLELRFAQFGRNRLPAGLTRHSMRPQICTLADFSPTLRNPVRAGLADKFEQLEKPATSCMSSIFFCRRHDPVDLAGSCQKS
jgi:hypothetical protein